MKEEPQFVCSCPFAKKKNIGEAVRFPTMTLKHNW